MKIEAVAMSFHCSLSLTVAQAGMETGQLSDASSLKGQYVGSGNGQDHDLHQKARGWVSKSLT